MDSFRSNLQSDIDTSLEPKRKRRRILDDRASTGGNIDVPCQASRRWTTEKEQQIYSSKLFQAIRYVRNRRNSVVRGREIRETANRVLAVSAKGATRWSRAILGSHQCLRLKRHAKVKVRGYRLLRRTVEMTTQKRKSPAAEKKLRVLGRLIPGCQKVPLSNLLEEATDYISALEMQVRAMAALAEILSASPPEAGDHQLGSNVIS